MTQLITSELEALLTARMRAGASGFRGRIAIGEGGAGGACYGLITPGGEGAGVAADLVITPGSVSTRWRFLFRGASGFVVNVHHDGTSSSVVKTLSVDSNTAILGNWYPGPVVDQIDLTAIVNISGFAYAEIQIDADGTAHAKLWNQNDAEPGAWQLEGNVDIVTSGDYTGPTLDRIRLLGSSLQLHELAVAIDGGALTVIDDFQRDPDPEGWGGEWSIVEGAGANASLVCRVSRPPKRISIDRTRRLAAAQLDVDFENEDLGKGYYTGVDFIPNQPIQAFMWYGDPANEVCVFTGIVDRVHEHRDPRTVSVTARSRMKWLIEQVFIATAPNGAEEEGAVLTQDNGVYTNMAIEDIVADILDRGGWPVDDRVIFSTGIVLPSFTIPDLTPWAEAITGSDRLAAVAGCDLWDDELGVIHFEPSPLTDVSEPTPDYTMSAGVDIMALDHEADDVDRKTRLRVVGPMTSLAAAWTETWGTTILRYPVGAWYTGDPTSLNVITSLARDLVVLSQADRHVIARYNLASELNWYPGGLSGDPDDPDIYWVLDINWVHGGNNNARIVKFNRFTNLAIDTYPLPDGQWTDIKSDGSFLWLTRFDTDRLYKRDINDGSAIDSWTYPGHPNPTGMYLNGTTIGLFFNGESRFRLVSTSAPGTITGTQSTAGTSILGGEIDSDTGIDLYAVAEAGTFGAANGHVWKFSLASEVTNDVVATASVADLEDALGVQSGIAPRPHDLHSSMADHPFEIRLLEVQLQVVTSSEQALAVATAALIAAQRIRRSLDVMWVGNPAVQVNDVLEIIDPISGLPNPWILDTYRAEMSGDGLYVGSGSVLPWESPVEVDGDIEDPTDEEPGGGDSGPPPPPPGTFPGDSDLAYVAPPSIPALPDMLTPTTDPTWGTTVTRISEAGVRHAYSRRAAWNSDASLLLLDYGPVRPLLDGTTYAEVDPNLSTPGFATWANTDPYRLYGTDSGNNYLRAIDPRDSSEVYSETFGAYDEVLIGDGEGTISDDDQTIVLMTQASGVQGLIVVDVPTGNIVADITFSTRPNNASISRLGNYVLVSWGPDGAGSEQGMWVYDRDLTNPRQLRTQARHGDPGLTSDGHEVWVQCSPEVESFDLLTAVGTQLLPSGSAFTDGHVSCRNIGLDGWAFLSPYAYDPPEPGTDQIIAVNLDGSGDIRVFCFSNHRGDGSVYEEQPQAVPSPDGQRVLFASEWGGGSGPYTFVAQA